ncbi:hypothetical protein [Cloacibacillus evryensis]|uniref:hypothetical protein n=1 Tax=Cloacibacillus evryensis TaxID=508460 RepID=UPI00210E4CCC|nr:hypothetical protein [Cloacibacillus evryensis]
MSSGPCRMVAFCFEMDKKHVFPERFNGFSQREIRPEAHKRLACEFCLKFEDDGKGQCVFLRAHYASVNLRRR